jgi:signal transduction histidine kinase
MFTSWGLTLVSIGYLGILSAIARMARRSDAEGSGWVRSPLVYALSLGVYCSAWTYYGSVGQAAREGLHFLAIYLGPSLMMLVAPLLLRKTIRICRVQSIDTVPDFLSARFGKHPGLGALAVGIMLIGIVPYLALQLKAIGMSAALITQQAAPTASTGNPSHTPVVLALIGLGLFIAFFSGFYNNSRRHPGIVAAIAFESIIKLVALLALGLWVCYGYFDSPLELFAQAREQNLWRQFQSVSAQGGQPEQWGTLLLLSASAAWLLPRQFLMGVSENMSEHHLPFASWAFPLYLFLINLMVIPVCLAGLLTPAIGTEPDMFVIGIPLHEGRYGLALLMYLGGLSASTGMVIVSALALGTALTNNVVVPLLSWRNVASFRRASVWAPRLQHIRQASLLLVLALSYLYYRLIGEYHSLVSTGLISFVAIFQFLPPMLAALYWKRATRRGAFWGLSLGFGVWSYTLLFPSLIRTGLFPESWLESGPLGLPWLHPEALLGLTHFTPLMHGFFWSVLANASGLVIGSLRSRPSPMEHNQAEIFVDIFRYSTVHERSVLWKGTVYLRELEELLGHFLGPDKAHRELMRFCRENGLASAAQSKAAPPLVAFSEQQLAGVVGATSARILMATVVREDPLSMEDVMNVLKETQQFVAYNKALRQKSDALEKATDDLRRANEQLKRMSTVKDEFISTVTHELRTPLTSIRAFAEILQENEDLAPEERGQFLDTLVKESERMSRLIEQVLDLERLEAGRYEMTKDYEDINEIVREVAGQFRHLVEERGGILHLQLQDRLPLAHVDRDHIKQVLINLFSNAAKHMSDTDGWVKMLSYYVDQEVKVLVIDNGPGIPEKEQGRVFDKFHQVRQGGQRKPAGSGLGLAIAQQIVEAHEGRIWASNQSGAGARFCFCLPCTTVTYSRPRAHAQENLAGR